MSNKLAEIDFLIKLVAFESHIYNIIAGTEYYELINYSKLEGLADEEKQLIVDSAIKSGRKVIFKYTVGDNDYIVGTDDSLVGVIYRKNLEEYPC